tara:strand:- start:70047 stop:70442 length:396 start_codon:yes stop_codon:yes gene_type:complete
MKLYNIFEGLILENTTQTLNDAINGKYAVNIWYRDKKTNTLEQRYVFIYSIGTSKAGNEIVTAFQAFGGTKSGNSKWKSFLVNNIVKIQPTDFKFYKSVDQVKGGEGIPKYTGASNQNMIGGPKNYVKFNK